MGSYINQLESIGMFPLFLYSSLFYVRL